MNAKSLIILLISAIWLSSCKNEDPDPEPIIPPTETPRTVLVYMVASNSLNSAASDDLESMRVAIADGALKKGGRLLVYKVGYQTSPELIELTANGTETLKSYPDITSSVNAITMSDVFDDMKKLAPASDYGAIFWSHSTGWLSPAKVQSKSSRSWGDDRGAKMSIPDMAKALKDKNLSFIYFDCCFMGNIESLYEFRDVTPYIVASVAEVPADGMPYEINLRLFFDETPDLTGIARNTYEHYDALTGANRSCTMTVYDMSAISSVAEACSAILSANHATPDGMEYQQYGFHTSWNNFENMYYDLGQYYESLTDDKSLLDSFQEAMSKFIVYSASTPQMWGQWNLTHTSGVSTYIYSEDPAKGISNGYQLLSWWEDVVGPHFQ